MNTVDTRVAKTLAEAGAIRAATLVGMAGGWAVVVKFGVEEKALAAQRSGKPRMWRKLETCLLYLRQEFGLVRFELDSAGYSPLSLMTAKRPDVAQRMRKAFEKPAAKD